MRFRLWAPAHDWISLIIEGDQPLAMESLGEGWHELATNRAAIGSRYRFALPDGSRVPDPASRFQPEDVHGPSQVMGSQSYVWRDSAWSGRPWREAILYELHVGTFTEAGTFRAAAGKIDHLLALGITAIEIMPIADFPGRWNWGYDGVFLYAPDSTYGEPDDFKAFVDAAHARGIMVFLDVVYNHFGPKETTFRPTLRIFSRSAIKQRGELGSTTMGRLAGRCESLSSRMPCTGLSNFI